MIYESVNRCIGHTPLVSLNRLFPADSLKIIAKLEFLNPSGSIKDRVAQFIVEEGLRDGTIHSETHLIESSSGNMGIVFAMVARVYALAFTCVVDPKISPTNLRILQKLGTHIEMVNAPDDQGGYLKTRIERVKTLLQVIPRSCWINQYANDSKKKHQNASKLRSPYLYGVR